MGRTGAEVGRKERRMRLNDLISRQETINKILEYFIEYHGGAFREDDQRALIEVFKKMPTVDAESVIRCKDCRYYDYGENPSETWSVCTAHINCYIETCADNFCSWAERKDIRTFTAEEWEFYKKVNREKMQKTGLNIRDFMGARREK